MQGNKLLISIAFIVGCLVILLAFYVKKLEKKATFAEEINSLSQQGSVAQLAGKIVPVSSMDHIKGNKNAKITVIEYSDFQCTECQTIQPTIDKIVKNYGNKIRFITRALPLPQHPDAITEAEAAECAGEIGGENMYWKYSRIVFDRSMPISTGVGFPLTKLTPLAKELGIDEKRFSACLQSGKYEQKIKSEIADGDNIGIHQLPSMVIIAFQNNTKLIVGEQPYSVYQTVLDMTLL